MHTNDSRPSWGDQLDRIVSVCRERLPQLVGVYLHGSAALGGFGPGSDLDVLVVSRDEADWAEVGRSLLVASGEPRSLELSVVHPAASAKPAAPWPFLLHVNTGEGRWALDSGGGDQDLALHYLVTRAKGVALVGLPVAEVIGDVPASDVAVALREELRWAAAQGDQRYAVLNACRARAWADEGLILSKVEGARWWL